MPQLTILLVVFFLLSSPSQIKANNAGNQFITIVNPVRVSIYSQDPISSLKNQYQIVEKNNLAASWLFTYDAFNYPGIKEVISEMDKNQDIGIFMEVSENYASRSGVLYNKSDSWHRSTSIFLSGYTQADRIKLIDSVFEEFKKQFGFYPTSIGAWWIDSFSLDYMQKKYGITANLVVADQLGTDGYTIWGQFWGTPYYPSKNHAAMPAQNLENKLDIINLQWASRDPLNGYSSPNELRSSLFSTQDYYTMGLQDEYFESLINLYAGTGKNEFGQITFGLEGDFGANSYDEESQYAKYIEIAKKFADTGNFTVTNMKQFSDWYRTKFPLLSPNYLVESEDLLAETGKKAIWYQNPNYRAGIIFDKNNKKLKFIDLRIYPQNFQEPFYLSKNGQLDLYINLPSVIDTALDPQRYLELENIDSVVTSSEGGKFKINLNDDHSIELLDNQISLNNINQKLPDSLTKSDLISINQSKDITTLGLQKDFPVSEAGYKFRDLTLEATYFLNTKKVKLAILAALILVGLGAYKFRKAGKQKVVVLVIVIILLSAGSSFWYFKNSQQYYASQSEIEALLKLKTYPSGKVLVLNHDCLPCKGGIEQTPAAFANKRSYVKKISDKNLRFDDKLIESYSTGQTILTKLKREESKAYLKKMAVDYIYLVKHEDYAEKLPYSPGDLGVEQIYFNSDAEIWRVKE